MKAPHSKDMDSLLARTAERVAAGMTAEAALAWSAQALPIEQPTPPNVRPIDATLPREVPTPR